jgi:signal transduction histidine kinase
MARERSLGTRWALRYALAMFVVVASVLGFHYSQTRERIERDAQLLMRLQANELVGVIQRGPDDVEALERYIDQQAALGYRVLQLGFRVLDNERNVVLESGSLQNSAIPVPEDLPMGRGQDLVGEADGGAEYPFFTMCVRAPSGGWVQVAVNTQLFARSAREIRNLFLLSLPIVLLLTTGIGIALARSSLKPIARIIASVEEVSTTQLTHHVSQSGSGDELDRLATAFNSMTDRIREGVFRMRRFSAHAAHELRTPVSLMRNRLESALDDERNPERDGELIEGTLRDVGRLTNTISAMLRLAHSEAGLDPEQLRQVSIREALGGVVEFFEPLAEDAEVGLRLVPSQDGSVIGDPTWLHQLFANLVDNAIKFTPSGGQVAIVVDPATDFVTIVVEDTGVGVPEDERERIFESFHRADSTLARKGSGLGLPLAREIARAHGGDLQLLPNDKQGSRVVVRLPVAGPGAGGSFVQGRAPEV